MTTRPLGERDVRRMRKRSGEGGGGHRGSRLCSSFYLMHRISGKGMPLLQPYCTSAEVPSAPRLPSASRGGTEADSARLLVLITAPGLISLRNVAKTGKGEGEE